jgi:hypothetical protein
VADSGFFLTFRFFPSTVISFVSHLNLVLYTFYFPFRQ